MFKRKNKDKPEMNEPVLEGELTVRCTSYMEHPNSLTFNSLVRECGNIGNLYLKTNFYMQPLIGRTAYQPYNGTGIISIDRTVQNICIHGRRLDTIVSRMHVKDKQRNNLAILIDNSAQMTAEWQAEKTDEEVKPKYAPQNLVKIAAISILESIGREADEIDIVVYGDEADGPFNQWQLPYKQLLGLKGKGLCRLDMGLARLLQLEWEMRPGNRFLFILGGGLPYTGTNILIDDMEIQVNVLYYLSRMLRQGVKIAYIPFFTNEDVLDERVGAFSQRGLAETMKRVGVAVSEINNETSLPLGLRNGFRDMMIGPVREMTAFEL
jgi:hypothetical protein